MQLGNNFLFTALFNIFLERILSDALEGSGGKISIGGSTITDLKLVNDFDAVAKEELVLIRPNLLQTASVPPRGRSRLKDISLEQLQASSTLEQLF